MIDFISSKFFFKGTIPKGHADLIISLEPMESLRYLPYLKKEGWLVTNSRPFVNIPNYPEIEKVNAELDVKKNVRETRRCHVR